MFNLNTLKSTFCLTRLTTNKFWSKTGRYVDYVIEGVIYDANTKVQTWRLNYCYCFSIGRGHDNLLCRYEISREWSIKIHSNMCVTIVKRNSKKKKFKRRKVIYNKCGTLEHNKKTCPRFANQDVLFSIFFVDALLQIFLRMLNVHLSNFGYYWLVYWWFNCHIVWYSRVWRTCLPSRVWYTMLHL